jgi:hypothetical protein
MAASIPKTYSALNFTMKVILIWYYYSLVSIATRLQAGRPRNWGSCDRARYISPLHGVQTDSGTCPASYTVGTGGFFPGGKVAGV